VDGVAVIDKPEGWTSHDVVAKFRGISKTKRVGHLGTLDPMATGVLPLVVGAACRLARFYTGARKVYEAGVRFGFATDTYDRTGVPNGNSIPVNIGAAELEAALVKFRGRMLQMPPQYSAKKVRGIVAYKAARNNIPVDLQPIEVEIHELALMSFDGQRAELRIRCSAGTYIRSIAHDLGAALGCGAHLDSLRRLASGEFTLEQAQPLATAQLIPLAQMLPQFPAFTATEQTATAIRQGRVFEAQFEAAQIRALSELGDLIAICDRTAPGLYHPSVVVG